MFGAFHFDTACFDDAYDVAHVDSRMNMMSVMPLYRLALVRFPFLPFIVGVVLLDVGWFGGLEFTGSVRDLGCCSMVLWSVVPSLL